MSSLKGAWLFLVAAVACGSDAARDSGAPSQTEPPWRLVWSDEFDTAGLPDPAKWYYDTGGHGWGNNELQFYTERRLENARVEGGRLIVEARRERWAGARLHVGAPATRGPGWTYGRIEVRAKLPSGRGTWPAIWMLPVDWTYGNRGWPDNGEIDIMEHVGFDPDVIHASIHTQAYNHVAGTQKTARISVPGARDSFHVFVVEWTDREIRALRRRPALLHASRTSDSQRSAGRLPALAVRQELSRPAQHRRRRNLGRSAGRGRVHLAAADGS